MVNGKSQQKCWVLDNTPTNSASMIKWWGAVQSVYSFRFRFRWYALLLHKNYFFNLHKRKLHNKIQDGMFYRTSSLRQRFFFKTTFTQPEVKNRCFIRIIWAFAKPYLPLFWMLFYAILENMPLANIFWIWLMLFEIRTSF